MSGPEQLAGGSSDKFIARAERYVVLSALGFAALFATAALAAGGTETLARMAAVAPTVLIGMLALSLVNYALRFIRWQIFGLKLGIDVAWRISAIYYAAGLSMAATPGKMGEALRLWLLRQGHGWRYERTFSLFIGDRLYDLTAIVALCLVGASTFGGYLWSAALAGGATAALSVVILRPRYAIAVLTAFYRWTRRWKRPVARLRHSIRYAGRLASPGLYCGAMALSIGGWMAEAGAFHWLLVEMGTTVSLTQSIFIFCFSMLVGVMAMLPGGLGGTEATMVGLLATLGVDLETAIAATAIIRITTLWFAVGLGFVFLPASLRTMNRGRQSRQERSPA